MSDLVVKSELLNIIGKMQFCYEYGRAVSDIYHIVKDHPVVDIDIVVHGEWIPDGRGVYYCSVCDSEAYWTEYGQQLFKYCQECGARMDGEKRRRI